MLRFEDSLVDIGQLDLPDSVLIGGQALNYWCNAYAHAAELASLPPLTSKDTDFQGSLSDAQSCAHTLSGRLQQPANNALTQLVGVVHYVDRNNISRQVDFLRYPLGLTAEEVTQLKVLLPDSRLWVMHPMHCLISRTSNVAREPGAYANAHGLGQLRAAVLMLRAFVLDVATHEEKQARKLCRWVLEYARSDDALAVFTDHAIDVAACVPAGALHPTFLEQEYPRSVERLEAARSQIRPKLRRD